MKNRSTKSVLAALLMSSISLTACSIGTVQTAEQVTKGAVVDATHYMDQASQPLPPADTSPIHMSDDVYTTGYAHRSDNGQPLPREWERDGSFVIKSATLLSLYDIGTELTQVTGIPVDFAPDVMATEMASTAAATPAKGVLGAPTPTLPSSPQDITRMLGSMGLSPNGSSVGGNLGGSDGSVIRPLQGTRDQMKIDYQGRLSEFLNQVSAYFSVSWEYSGKEIRFFKNVTRTYTVHALPSTITNDEDLSSSSAASSSGGSSNAGVVGGSTSDAKSSIEIAIWKDISSAVSSIVGNYGSVSTSVSTGTITVTAPPDVITRVQTYLDGQNARLNKQVSVSVQVLDVEITDGDQYGLNLTAAFKDASTFGLGVVSPATTVASTAGGLTYSVLGGKFANTSAIVQALSTTGRVTVRTTASVTTLNGVPAPLQVANTRGYVASITIVPATSTGTGTSTSNQETLNTATVTTGFSLSVLPRIDESGQGLLMQFGVNISDLEGANNGFDNFTTPDGTETVQLPDINSRNFVQQAYIPNGATLVMTGFEQANDTANKSGVGNAGFLGLGGSQVGTHTRDIVVILMTPVILDAGAPIVSVDGE